jgi:hypothetical protein
MKSRYSLLVLLVFMMIGSLAQAQSYTTLDVIGFMFESDNDPGVQGFPPSNVGDVLAGVGFVDGFSQTMEYSQADYEYTWYVSNLVSQGEIDLGNGQIRMYYTGGNVDVYIDNFMDAAYTYPMYGVDPPDAGVLGDFTDGLLYLHGTFTSFVLTYDTVNHFGNYQGLITFELGPLINGSEDGLEYPDGMTFAGVIGSDLDPTVPDGYDMEADGHIYFDPTIPNEDVTWSNVKNLYR